MQKFRYILFALLFVGIMFGCTSKPNSQTDPTECTRISVAEAERLVRDMMFQENPDMNPEAQFPLEEKTTDEIWERLHLQIFRLQSDFLGPMTFSIADGEVDILGASFGGFGVTSMIVTDLDSDMHPELIYTFSFGSGIHRSHIAVYYPGRAQPHIFDEHLRYMHGDLILEKIDDQTVVVSTSFRDWENDEFVPETQIGQLFLKSKDGQEILFIEQNPDLPEEIRVRLTAQ